jgi:hypothetical protein
LAAAGGFVGYVSAITAWGRVIVVVGGGLDIATSLHQRRGAIGRRGRRIVTQASGHDAG